MNQLEEKLRQFDKSHIAQFVADLHDAFSELSMERDPPEPDISHSRSSPVAKTEVVAEDDAAERNDSFVLDGSGTPAADVHPPNAADIAGRLPIIIDELDELAPALMAAEEIALSRSPEAHSLEKVRSRWISQVGIFLVLGAVITSIPLRLPTPRPDLSDTTSPMPRSDLSEITSPLPGPDVSETASPIPNPDLSETTPPHAEAAIDLNALKPSAGGQTAIVAPIEVATAPAAQVANPPSSVDVIGQLIGRADQLLRQGDVVSARSFYERAVLSGDPRALRSMARTFDPKFLSQLGVVGIRGNAEYAATLYRKADEADARNAKSQE